MNGSLVHARIVVKTLQAPANPPGASPYIIGRGFQKYPLKIPESYEGGRGNICTNAQHGAQTREHLLRKQNVSEQIQEHFRFTGSKFCFRSDSFVEPQTGKPLLLQHCFRVSGRQKSLVISRCCFWTTAKKCTEMRAATCSTFIFSFFNQ